MAKYKTLVYCSGLDDCKNSVQVNHISQTAVCDECKRLMLEAEKEASAEFYKNPYYLVENKCQHCNKAGIKDGDEVYDPCIGKLDGVMAACCGHGLVKSAYVQFNHVLMQPIKRISGQEALDYIRDNRSVCITCDGTMQIMGYGYGSDGKDGIQQYNRIMVCPDCNDVEWECETTTRGFE